MAGSAPAVADPYATAPYPAAVQGQGPAGSPQVVTPDDATRLYAPEELEDLVGPIALYPDDLIAIVLPASTFPLQVVAAARFLERRESDPAAEPDPQWDDAVVALLNYPEVVALMNDDLDWLGRLGDAVIYQQPDVLAAIAGFRDRAYDCRQPAQRRSPDRQPARGGHRDCAGRPRSDLRPLLRAGARHRLPERARLLLLCAALSRVLLPLPRTGYWHDPFWPRSFWGVSLVFNIGWDSYRLSVRDHGYWRPPHYGRRHYYGAHDGWHSDNGRNGDRHEGHGSHDDHGHDNRGGHDHGWSEGHGTTTAGASQPPGSHGQDGSAKGTPRAKPPVRDLTRSTHTRVATDDSNGRSDSTIPGHGAGTGAKPATRSPYVNALQPSARAATARDEVRYPVVRTRSTSAITLPRPATPQTAPRAQPAPPPRPRDAPVARAPSTPPSRQQIAPRTQGAPPRQSASPQYQPAAPTRVITRSTSSTSATHPAPSSARSYSTGSAGSASAPRASSASSSTHSSYSTSNARSASPAHASAAHTSSPAPARAQPAPARSADHGDGGNRGGNASRGGKAQARNAQRK